MLGEFLIFAQIFAVQKRSPEVRHLLFESAGQNRQTHDLDQADVLLFDVVQLLVRMIEAHRMFRRGQIVAKHKIEFIAAVSHAGNRRDRIVRLAVGFRENHRIGVTVTAPLRKDFAREVAKLVLVRTV